MTAAGDTATEKSRAASPAHGTAGQDPLNDNKSGLSTDRTDDPKPEQDIVGEDGQDTEDESVYPSGLPLILVIASLCLAVFLVALDQTIIAPALGAITSEYKSVKDIVSSRIQPRSCPR